MAFGVNTKSDQAIVYIITGTQSKQVSIHANTHIYIIYTMTVSPNPPPGSPRSLSIVKSTTCCYCTQHPTCGQTNPPTLLKGNTCSVETRHVYAYSFLVWCRCGRWCRSQETVDRSLCSSEPSPINPHTHNCASKVYDHASTCVSNFGPDDAVRSGRMKSAESNLVKFLAIRPHELAPHLRWSALIASPCASNFTLYMQDIC